MKINYFEWRKLNFAILNWILFFLIFILSYDLTAQISNAGCVSGKFGIDSGLYSGVVEFGAGSPAAGSHDWFQGPSGRGIIDETNVAALKTILQNDPNPLYERRQKYNLVSINDNQILIDGLFARDYFGGTGERDQTSYLTSSKNGEDPAIWDPGTSNVLGKNDIIDVGGHMFRDGTNISGNLWFVGLFNMAEPGGTAYMDFEFYVAGLKLVPRSGGGIKFTSGGPDLGHTAYEFDNSTGNIKKVGDFIFSVTVSGQNAVVETRLWVKKTALNKTPSTFDWTGTFDGPYSNSLYGYAGIKPKSTSPAEICGYVNGNNESPLAPPWGTKGTKSNSWETSYAANSLSEVSINLTALGIDHASLSGADPCYFPLNTFIVKTRASDSFTAQLKDFAGPYTWGQPTNSLVVQGDPLISCDNLTPTLTVSSVRTDVTYSWSTIDGNIISPTNQASITINKPGTYTLTSYLPTGCPMPNSSVVIGFDTTKPLFIEPAMVNSTVSCNANDGTINVSVTGGTPPYTFTWTKDGSPYAVVNSASGTSQLTGLAPGTYKATIKGQYACQLITTDVVVAGRVPVNITSPVITSPSCKGLKNGAINHSVSGGKAPLRYLWSTGASTQNLLNVGAGNYTLNVTDADGCVTTANYTIIEPAALTATFVKTDDTNPDPILGTGTINLTPSGGTGPYTFSWVATETGTVPSGQANNKDLNSLDFGRYTVTITDSKGCVATASVFIYEPEVCSDGIDNDGDGLADCSDNKCVPATPSSIEPNNPLLCLNDEVTYTVQVNPNYSSYEWTLPPNATYISGQGTNNLVVKWSAIGGGQLCVQGKKGDCLGASSCIYINVTNEPEAPGKIVIKNN